MKEIKTSTFAINYRGGSYQGTQFVQPIATGIQRDGTKVLLCRSESTKQIKCLDFSKIKTVTRVIRSTLSIERPSEYIDRLFSIQSEGIPLEWLDHTNLPAWRDLGTDPDTMAVDTIPYSFCLYQ